MSKEKILIVITGASQGFGSSVATQCNLEFTKMVLISRSEELLQQTKNKIKLTDNTEILKLDLSIEQDFKKIFSKYKDLSFTKVYLINNVGTLGNLDFINTAENVSGELSKLNFNSLQHEFNLNLNNCFLITTEFLNLFKNGFKKNAAAIPHLKIHIINISSLAAIKAFECWSIYCAQKAARDMFFKTLALEESSEVKKKDGVTVRILNYAPGPLDTEMQKKIRDQMPPIPLRETFIKMKLENSLINCDDSAKVLWNVLKKDDYNNGDHIDYFDCI
ncbi:hypothetical protein HDU92_002773 [Lobulomyces angularis]|nr:hypothetical protein HDU92_002773 [Lobulomyces angularis]